jgi:hypothetical protein
MNVRRIAVAVALLFAGLGVASSTGSPSSPYRPVEFLNPKHAKPQGDIQVIDGWGAIKRNSKGAIFCLSFRNNAELTATRVVFELPIVGASGATVAKVELDTHGTFPTGTVIPTWENLAQWRAQAGDPKNNENCKILSTPASVFPVMFAHAFSYRVVRIEYANGHVLTP